MVVVIPTRNRWPSLVVALRSILAQSQRPKRILIVDQSERSYGEPLEQLMRDQGISFTYLHVYPESGLVRAKQRAVKESHEDLVCFLEDDVILDRQFLEELGKTFVGCPNALGVGGLCRNSPGNNLIYACLHRLFYRGIFTDTRPWITLGPAWNRPGPVLSSALSGGISAWRREVLQAVAHVPEEGFHMMEDLHYSRKTIRRFGPRLWINPRATLQHLPCQEGRALAGKFEQKRIQETFAFYRYHKEGIFDFLFFLWLASGLTFFSIIKCLNQKSLQPILGHLRGLCDCLWTGRKKLT